MPKNKPADDFLFSPSENKGSDWRNITLSPEFPPVKPSTPNNERDKKQRIRSHGGGKGHTERVASSLLTSKVAEPPEKFGKRGFQPPSLLTSKVAEPPEKFAKSRSRSGSRSSGKRRNTKKIKKFLSV